MSVCTQRSRVERVLPIVAGIVLIGATVLVDAVISVRTDLGFFRNALVIFGCVLLVLGLAGPGGRTGVVLARVSLVVLATVFSIGLAESVFRIAGFNFNPVSNQIPIFNRPASLHMGDGVMRRPGPATWRGRPISSLIHYVRGNENACPDEQPIEVRYDRLGFRNPPDLTDWEVVVTGDSFVESGYLPYEQIFTSIAANRLGVRVKNLGVSGTGPVYQTAYVKKYGKAPSTRHAVLCFFDGNDVSDLIHEVGQTNFICRTGHRIGGENQGSLIVAVYDRVSRLSTTLGQKNYLLTNAVFHAADRDYPASFSGPPPPRWEDLKAETRELITTSLANWGRTVREQGMQPWVMCIPDSRRVFAGHISYLDTNNTLMRWQSREFGPPLAKVCANLDIRFVDAFPALRHEVEAGRVPYNLFGDVHLSAHGSRIVGELLAETLRADLQKRH